ncbi:MAG: acyltransferase [Terriglobales bacterium]
MSGAIAGKSIPRNNNFDLIRLVLASVVVIVHCHDLSLQPGLAWLTIWLDSGIAVKGFFAISGCLIVASYERSSSLRDYFEKRMRRILPAYWASLVLSLIVGSIFTALPLPIFLRSLETVKYVGANLVFANFLCPSLPGVFVDNPATSAMNGALWTIKVEIGFYLSVPIIVWCCRKFGTTPILGSIFVAGILFDILCGYIRHPEWTHQLPGQLPYFIVGAAVYYNAERFRRYGLLIVGAATVLYVCKLKIDWVLFQASSVSVLVLAAALLTPKLTGLTKYGDFSYGVYIYHFPVIQALIVMGLFRRAPYLAMAVVVCIVALLSAISWFTLERPVLRRSHKYQPVKGPKSSPITPPVLT